MNNRPSLTSRGSLDGWQCPPESPDGTSRLGSNTDDSRVASCQLRGRLRTVRTLPSNFRKQWRIQLVNATV